MQSQPSNIRAKKGLDTEACQRMSPSALAISQEISSICGKLEKQKQENLTKKQEQVFVDQFRNFYKPGLFGGYWGRFGRTKDISKQAIEDYAQKNPKSATAKAVQEISKRPLGLG